MLLVYASIDSLFPRICAVEAVGMGASRSEFLTPCCATRAFSADQSHREDGVTPHMSYCRICTNNAHTGHTQWQRQHSSQVICVNGKIYWISNRWGRGITIKATHDEP